jgi:hypothetical protein
MVTNETDIVNLALMHLGNEPITDIDGTDTVSVWAAEVYDENRDYVLTLREWASAIKRLHLTLASIKDITAITAAEPPVVTCSGHAFANGQLVTFSDILGMTELNANIFVVAGVATNTLHLHDMEGEDIDASAYTAYASSGHIYLSPGPDWAYAYDLPTDCLKPLEVLDENMQGIGEWPDQYPYVAEGRVLYCDVEYAALRYTYQATDPSKYDSSLVEAMALRLAWVLSNKVTGSTVAIRQDLEGQVHRMRIQAGLVDARAKRSREPREKPWR